MLGKYLENVRDKCPLVHNITNYVTVNDCANALLAIGASPIMADDSEEVEEITALCTGLNLNIGTLNRHTIPAMYKAGRKANQLHHPIVLDPVGAGASTLRTETAASLASSVRPTVIRGNVSEIQALLGQKASSRGVDVSREDQIHTDQLDEAAAFAMEAAEQLECIIAITGAVDLVSDGQSVFCIYNGRPEMASVTGTGCQLSALIAAFLAASPENPLESTAAAVCTMGLCGETAFRRMNELDGNTSYRNYMIDAMYHLSPEDLEKGARFEMR